MRTRLPHLPTRPPEPQLSSHPLLRVRALTAARAHVRALALATLAVAACADPAAPPRPGAADVALTHHEAVTGARPSGHWSPVVLATAPEVFVAPPPAGPSDAVAQELAELVALQAARTAETQARIARWDAAPAFAPWAEMLAQRIVSQPVNVPRGARAYALLQAAVYDAVIATWHWKHAYRRDRPADVDSRIEPAVASAPVPSYPSEHAAVAGAAAGVLAYLFPNDAGAFDLLAEEAAASRLEAGTNYRSDVEAGLALGKEVAALVVARRAMTDGSDGVWDAVLQPGRRFGPGFWQPTSAVVVPTEPLAGQWTPWVVGATANFVAPPPPVWREEGGGSIDMLALVRYAVESFQAVAITRSEPADGPQRSAIGATAGHPSTVWNRHARALMVRDGLDLPHAARIAFYVSAGAADALCVSWRNKYVYWTARPQTVIRAIASDPELLAAWQAYLPTASPDPLWTSFRATPPDPSYTSGLSTVSGLNAEVLSIFFPADAAVLRGRATEAAMSRLYDGSHWSFDNEAGLALGRAMAGDYADRIRKDGAPFWR